MEEKVLNQSKNTIEKSEEKKQEVIRISHGIDEKLDVIRKNLDFCNENGCPEALTEGGKYFVAFQKLINSTVAIELAELKETLITLLPWNREKQELIMMNIINKVLDSSKEQLVKLTQTCDESGLKNEIYNIKKIYAENYVQYQIDQLSL